MMVWSSGTGLRVSLTSGLPQLNSASPMRAATSLTLSRTRVVTVVLAAILVATACGLGSPTVVAAGPPAPGAEPAPTQEPTPTPTTTPADEQSAEVAAEEASGEEDSNEVLSDEVVRGTGSFTLSAPAAVDVGQEFRVSAEVEAGANVWLIDVDGGCQHQGSWQFGAPLDATTCRLTFGQRDSDTHVGAEDQVASVEVLKGLGSFSIEAPAEVVVGSAFSLSATAGIGGDTFLEDLMGGCAELGDGQYQATSVGECTFTIGQRPTPEHEGAPSQTATVLVIKAQGSFRLAAPEAVAAGSTFLVQATVESGGEVTVLSADGGCLDLGNLGFEAPASVTTCVITMQQQETPTHASAGTKTVSVPVTRSLGSFEAFAPAEVRWGDTFAIDARLHAGGPLAAAATGGCEKVADLGFRAPDVAGGTCEITVTQEPTASHDAAPAATLAVAVVRRAGSFIVVVGGPYQSGQVFDVAVTDVVGGDVELTAVAGACEYDDYESSFTPANEYSFYGTAAGDCQITFVQADTTNYQGGSQTATITIEKRPGRFRVLDYPALTNRDFEVLLEVAEGGDITAATTGLCQFVGRTTDEVLSFDWVDGAQHLDLCEITLRQVESAEFAPAPPQIVSVQFQKTPGRIVASVDRYSVVVDIYLGGFLQSATTSTPDICAVSEITDPTTAFGVSTQRVVLERVGTGYCIVDIVQSQTALTLGDSARAEVPMILR